MIATIILDRIPYGTRRYFIEKRIKRYMSYAQWDSRFVLGEPKRREDYVLGKTRRVRYILKRRQ